MKAISSALWSVFLIGSLFSADPFGLVIHLEGEVFVSRGILEFDAQVEEVLMWEDEIETGEDGSLQITFDSSFLSIGPNTLVSFEKETDDAGVETYRMILEEGRFRSKILNLGSQQFFEVVTEEGSLKVHGTDFVTQFSPDESSGLQVSVIQGAVAMQGGESESSEGGADVGEAPQASPTMVTQNQRGGVGGDVGGAVEDMSFSQMDDLKEELPLPGDADTALALDDFGLREVALDAFAEDVKEDQADVGEAVEAIEEEIIQQVLSEVTLILQGELDAPE